MDDRAFFDESFATLTGHAPLFWQRRLFLEHFLHGDIPSALDIPTGLGKTSVIAIWLLARALASEEARQRLPRRLVYVVDRRAVVDQATTETGKLRDALEGKAEHFAAVDEGVPANASQIAAELKKRLGFDESHKLPISTLRGAHVDNREWLDDPTVPAIIIGTIDMVGSRLLFSGYGVSRKMRPYHAGLLGVDALIVLDEAHLVPPFEHLLRAIEDEASLWSKDRTSSPRFIVLPLSATQREHPAEENGRKPFGLEERDRRDDTTSQRLNARKQLHIEPLAEKDHDRQLAEAAVALAVKGRPARVVVFCNRREKGDDGTGPSALGVAGTIVENAKREKIDIDPPQLLVGGRRLHEREQVAWGLEKLGFTGLAEPPQKPAFLIATSAGEVGVDFDADHMVGDLAPWERMVQRLGRVNRRGGEARGAQVVIFDTSGIEKDEARKALLTATYDLLKRIESEFDGKAGPAALQELRSRVGAQVIEKASTAEPLHPALTRALVDAWSMTSLESHTGRPEIAPWLRGWVEEKPQTMVIWRKYLPLRTGEMGEAFFSSKKETNEFFDAAPPHESEKLETETYRVMDWLHGRASRLLQRGPRTKNVESGLPELPADGADESRIGVQRAKEWRRDDTVALILSPSAEYEGHLTLRELGQNRKGRAKEGFHDILAGKILVIDAAFGGIATDGLLDDKEDSEPPTADAFDSWSKEAGFRVRRAAADDFEGKKDWRFEDNFVVRKDDNGDSEELLVVEHYKSAAQSEDARSVSQLQELGDHESLAEQKARKIAAEVGLCSVAAEALALAAIVHDEGKKAPRWQRAFRAPREKDETGVYKVFAKTPGPINQAILDGYRHEFGSLAVFELGNAWSGQLPAEVRMRIDDLSEERRDFLQHLVAAHHGFARPAISVRGCEDGPPSALEERARGVALRFARLQKRWGPWGLAWCEALLRAADSQASRDDKRGSARTPHAEEK